MSEAPTQGHIDTSTSQTQAKTYEETPDCRALCGSPLHHGVRRCTLPGRRIPHLRSRRICCPQRERSRRGRPRRLLRGAHLRPRPGCIPRRTLQPRHGCGRARAPGHRERTHRRNLPRFYRNPERYCRTPELRAGRGIRSGTGTGPLRVDPLRRHPRHGCLLTPAERGLGKRLRRRFPLRLREGNRGRLLHQPLLRSAVQRFGAGRYGSRCLPLCEPPHLFGCRSGTLLRAEWWRVDC